MGEENNKDLEPLFDEFLKSWKTTQLIRPEEAFVAFKAGYKAGQEKAMSGVRFILSPAPHNSKDKVFYKDK
jgi:hypothetical protein